MASSTRVVIWVLTEFFPLITAETVAMETPANLATSRMVENPDGCFNWVASCCAEESPARLVPRVSYRLQYSPIVHRIVTSFGQNLPA